MRYSKALTTEWEQSSFGIWRSVGLGKRKALKNYLLYIKN